jgi:hypothetical protein
MATSRTSPAERLQAYCQRALGDPRRKRYRIDERFVGMRALLDQGRDADVGHWADAGIEARDLPDLLAQLGVLTPVVTSPSRRTARSGNGAERWIGRFYFSEMNSPSSITRSLTR